MFKYKVGQKVKVDMGKCKIVEVHGVVTPYKIKTPLGDYWVDSSWITGLWEEEVFEEGEEVEVSNYGTKWTKRIYLATHPCCKPKPHFTIDKESEENFKQANGDPCGTESWAHIRKLPKKTTKEVTATDEQHKWIEKKLEDWK